MKTENYIKVTKDGKSHVLLAGNEAFYRSQGYQISKPTEAEVLAAFPELAAQKHAEERKRKEATELEKSNQTIQRLKKSNEELQKQIDEKDRTIEELKAAAKPDEETGKRTGRGTKERRIPQGREGETRRREEGTRE
jgi:predicted RNase H-like nuclease (RuvC/YqgF family)